MASWRSTTELVSWEIPLNPDLCGSGSAPGTLVRQTGLESVNRESI